MTSSRIRGSVLSAILLTPPILRLILAILLLALATWKVCAQPLPPPDIPTLQKAIAVIQQQRNQAFDAQAGAEVRAATLAEENAKLKAQVQALEAAAKPPSEPPKP